MGTIYAYPALGENIANDLEQAFLEGETGTILNHLASMAGYSSLEVDEHGRRTIKGEWLSIVKRPSERAQRVRLCTTPFVHPF